MPCRTGRHEEVRSCVTIRLMHTLAGSLIASSVVALTACVSTTPTHSPVPISNSSLRLIGSSDLGGHGFNGDIAIVGRTALVATGIHPAAGVHADFYNPYPCGESAVRIVDLTGWSIS